jgi:hypothetical protein
MRLIASFWRPCFARGRPFARDNCVYSNRSYFIEVNAAESIFGRAGGALFALICVACEATPLAQLINNGTLCKPLVGILNQSAKNSRGTLNMVKATTKKPARKAAAKKSVAKKATGKKGAVKKTARKAMAKKRPIKKAAAKKGSVKKTAAKKIVRKAPARKVSAKKVVRKPAARKPPPPPPPGPPETA